MAVIDEVLSILANSKDVSQLPTMTVLVNTNWVVVWNVTTNKAEKMSVGEFTKIGNWYFIEGSFVEKKTGNVDITTLEAGDEVYFKKITNAGSPVTLLGHTYDLAGVGGLDKQLESSYTQNQLIVT